MTETKDFPTLDVVTATSGVLVSSMDGLYELLSWILKDDIFTHQLIVAADTARPLIVAQHPWLDELDLPAGNLALLEYLTGQIVKQHGETLTLERPDDPDWIPGNAIVDLIDIMENRKSRDGN